MINYIQIGLSLIIGTAYIAEGDTTLVLPEAKITVKVIDVDGNPVTNANVNIGFNQGGNAWIGEYKSEMIRGLSDSNGLFSAQTRSLGDIGVFVEKENFYRSSGRQDYSGTYQGKKRWKPWNLTCEIILKEVRNPIPMYVKSIRTEISKVGVPMGYDLEKGDWVAPHGKGMHTDMIFQVDGHFKDFRDHDLTLSLSFPNEGDGIRSFEVPVRQGSKLRSSHVTPHSWYNSKRAWNSRRKRDPKNPTKTDVINNNTYEEKGNYYFRVRTVLDEKGNVEKACYGKIYGDIRFGGAEEGGVWLKDYVLYFNPKINDRNIEFDPDKNLFGGRERFAP